MIDSMLLIDDEIIFNTSTFADNNCVVTFTDAAVNWLVKLD